MNKNFKFDTKVDYSQPSEGRTIEFKLEDGNSVFVNEEERNHLMSFYWREKGDRYRKSRCLVESAYGTLKRCSADCSRCIHFMSGTNNGSTISLDALYEEYEFEVASNDCGPLEQLIKEEQNARIRKAVASIPDERDRRIVELFMYENLSDNKIAKRMSMPKRTVTYRRNKTFSELAKELENLKNN